MSSDIGGPIKRSRLYIYCNPGPKACPPRRSEACFAGTCMHQVITEPFFWRVKGQFTLTPRTDNIGLSYIIRSCRARLR